MYDVKEMGGKMQGTREGKDQREPDCELRSHKAIRLAISSAFQTLGMENQVENIYKALGGGWEIHFDGVLDKEQRAAVTKIAADKLGLYPENLTMCGFFPNQN